MATPSYQPLQLAAREVGFRLTPSDRAKIREEFDADALERLLSMIRPEMRRKILRHFQVIHPSEVEPGENLGWITEFTEPQLTAVLEEVYQPAWDQLPDEALDRPGYTYYPGRELARQRRDLRRRNQQTGGPPDE